MWAERKHPADVETGFQSEMLAIKVGPRSGVGESCSGPQESRVKGCVSHRNPYRVLDGNTQSDRLLHFLQTQLQRDDVESRRIHAAPLRAGEPVARRRIKNAAQGRTRRATAAIGKLPGWTVLVHLTEFPGSGIEGKKGMVETIPPNREPSAFDLDARKCRYREGAIVRGGIREEQTLRGRRVVHVIQLPGRLLVHRERSGSRPGDQRG